MWQTQPLCDQDLDCLVEDALSFCLSDKMLLFLHSKCSTGYGSLQSRRLSTRISFPAITEHGCWPGHGTVAKTEWRLQFSKKWVFKGEAEHTNTQTATTRTKLYVILVSLPKGPDMPEGHVRVWWRIPRWDLSNSGWYSLLKELGPFTKGDSKDSLSA